MDDMMNVRDSGRGTCDVFNGIADVTVRGKRGRREALVGVSSANHFPIIERSFARLRTVYIPCFNAMTFNRVAAFNSTVPSCGSKKYVEP